MSVDHYTPQDVKDAIAYFKSTSNRHDLTDILEAAFADLTKTPEAEKQAPATKPLKR